MSKYKIASIAGLLAIALVAVPFSSAFAGGRHYGGHGGYGGYGGYYGGALAWGLAGAVVGTAAALITAPIALLAAVAQAPVYYGGPTPGYPVAPNAYYGAPPYYAPPVARAYYGPPAAPAYYPPAYPPAYASTMAPVYYKAPAAPVYYGSPVGTAYYAPRPTYYAPRPAYYGPPARYNAAPGPRYYYGR